MRKIFALTMIALLSLTIALAAVGCGKKQETTESAPPAETSAPAETSMGGMMDTSMHADTSMNH